MSIRSTFNKLAISTALLAGVLSPGVSLAADSKYSAVGQDSPHEVICDVSSDATLLLDASDLKWANEYSFTGDTCVVGDLPPDIKIYVQDGTLQIIGNLGYATHLETRNTSVVDVDTIPADIHVTGNVPAKSVIEADGAIRLDTMPHRSVRLLSHFPTFEITIAGKILLAERDGKIILPNDDERDKRITSLRLKSEELSHKLDNYYGTDSSNPLGSVTNPITVTSLSVGVMLFASIFAVAFAFHNSRKDKQIPQRNTTRAKSSRPRGYKNTTISHPERRSKMSHSKYYIPYSGDGKLSKWDSQAKTTPVTDTSTKDAPTCDKNKSRDSMLEKARSISRPVLKKAQKRQPLKKFNM